MWGSYPEAAALNSVLFVSGLSLTSGASLSLRLSLPLAVD
jgi:hypothetical protein